MVFIGAVRLIVLGTLTLQCACSHYEVLNVSRDIDSTALRRAYHRQALVYHPDKNPGNPEANAQFVAISASYAILSDADLRAEYDAQLYVDETFALILSYAEALKVFIESLELDELVTEYGSPDWSKIATRFGKMGIGAARMAGGLAIDATVSLGSQLQTSISDKLGNVTKMVGQRTADVLSQTGSKVQDAREAIANLSNKSGLSEHLSVASEKLSSISKQTAHGAREKAEALRVKVGDYVPDMAGVADDIKAKAADVSNKTAQALSDFHSGAKQHAETLRAKVANSTKKVGQVVQNRTQDVRDMIRRKILALRSGGELPPGSDHTNHALVKTAGGPVPPREPESEHIEL